MPYLSHPSLNNMHTQYMWVQFICFVGILLATRARARKRSQKRLEKMKNVFYFFCNCPNFFNFEYFLILKSPCGSWLTQLLASCPTSTSV